MNHMLTKLIFILATCLLVLTLFCASETVAPPPPPVVTPHTDFDFVSLKCFDGETVKYELPPGTPTDSGDYIATHDLRDMIISKSIFTASGTSGTVTIITEYDIAGTGYVYIAKKIPHDTIIQIPYDTLVRIPRDSIIMVIEVQVTLKKEAGFLPPLIPGNTWVYLQTGQERGDMDGPIPSDTVLKTITVLAADESTILLSVRDSIMHNDRVTGTRTFTVNQYTDTTTWNDSAIVLDPRIGLSAPNFYHTSCTLKFTYNNQEYLLGDSKTFDMWTSQFCSYGEALVITRSIKNIGLVEERISCNPYGDKTISLIAFNNTPFLAGDHLPAFLFH